MDSVRGYSQLKHRFAAISSKPSTRQFMQALGLSAVREQKLRVRRKTGNTGRTIRVEQLTDTSVVTSAGGAAVFLEEGTRPHTITPRAAKALRFAASAAGRRLSGTPKVGAAVVFARVVHHPGTKPYPFMKPGAEAAVASSGTLGVIIKRWNDAA